MMAEGVKTQALRTLPQLQQTALQRAAMAEDGPDGLGRPTHVLLNGTGQMLVAWLTREPPVWTVQLVGVWHSPRQEFESVDEYLPDPSKATEPRRIPAHPDSVYAMWARVIDLDALWREVEQLADMFVDTGDDGV